VTPPENADGRGNESPADADRTSAVSVSDAEQTQSPDVSAEKPVAAPAEQETSGSTADANSANGTDGEGAKETDNGTPPPWQRMTGNGDQDTAQMTSGGREPAAAAPAEPAASAAPTQTTPATPAAPDNRASGPPGEDTVITARPVVSGTAAPQLFGQQTVNIPKPPSEDGGHPRTAVNLGVAQASGRPIGVAPPSALRRPGRGPRRASLQIKRVDPWSVLKLSLVIGVALFFVWLVAVGVLYTVLEGMGVWDKLNVTYNDLLQGGVDGRANEQLVSAGRVFGVAAIIGAVNIVLFSALTTVGAFVYNVSADLAGGLEVTLAERE
jgi:hypothetical protein